MTLSAAVARSSLLFAVCLVLGCGSKPNQSQGKRLLTTAVSPTSGYDPAWAPDGETIAYVRSDYVRDEQFGLFLDNEPDVPTPRDEISLWEPGSNRSRPLEIINQGKGRGFFTSLAWLDRWNLAFLATDLTAIPPGDDAEPWPWDWTGIIRYRVLPEGMFVVDTRKSSASVALKLGNYIQAEPISDGEVVVWSAEEGAGGHHVRLLTVNREGTIAREWSLPEGRWHSATGAIGTVRTDYPVLLRRCEGDESCLLLLRGDRVEDLYRTDARIAGVYGSPDGTRVAFVEEMAPEEARCYLRVLETTQGSAITVADHVFEDSRIAWAPDGRYIAYVRSDDGRLAIAEVPTSQ